MSEQSWKFVQSFGDDNSPDDDLVTSIAFDEKGENLAVGDKAGRICIFQAVRPKSKEKPGPQLEYRFFTEFQSHEAEFDYLKSIEIDERINMMKWMKRQSTGLFLLATNDKTVKLWRVHQRRVYNNTGNVQSDSTTDYKLPLKQPYQNDCETFLSADDLRINLWNCEVSNESWTIMDMKPVNLEELTEVVTSACFHPQHCNLFVYSTSRGVVKLADMRESALCDVHAKQFEAEDDPANKSFFSEIISSVSDTKFSYDGRYIIARDYLTIKIWDVNMENKPITVIPVHDYLKIHLVDLYENDCIFDKFSCDVSRNGLFFVTGSYNNNFTMYDTKTKAMSTIKADMSSPKRSKRTSQKEGKSQGKASKAEAPTFDVSQMDFAKKTLHVAYHPHMDIVAVAGLNKLYIYEGTQSAQNGDIPTSAPTATATNPTTATATQPSSNGTKQGPT